MPSVNQVSDLIENPENFEDEQRFKMTIIALISPIIEINEKNFSLYAKVFNTNLNIEENEFISLKKLLAKDNRSTDEKIDYIKKELGNNVYQIMQFLKILNRIIIVNGCKQKSYFQFENIRDTFLKEFY
ncbi:MAG: Unknown protein [uncultured Sulfurovum sp.]|uniref:Uncharacterized protein n=1 Tax=uncultured Sulfurovum sp. TaxID=269237 RepID=A0A6S6SIW4_9BACT|nr:MAG: Unknown protein [uncultured Sulfurovum sp.]